MSTIKVTCIDQMLCLAETPLIAAGGQNVDAVQYEFDASWDGYTKVGIFCAGSDAYNVLLDEFDTAAIPAAVLERAGRIKFGVYGVLGELRKASEALWYELVDGAIISGVEPPDPTIYEQLLRAYSTSQAAIVSEAAARAAADNAETAARNAALALKADLTDLTSPFNLRGAVPTADQLPLNASVNDTYYVTDRKYRMTWNGQHWFQSSLSEAEYEDELNQVNNKFADLKIGWDGRTYPEPGDAVRGQVGDVSEKTANTWHLRDVEVSPETYTSYPIRNISGSWPAGTYTIVATVDSEYSGNPGIAMMNGNSQLQWKEFRNHARSAVTFTIESDANRIRFFVGRTTSTTLLGLTAWYRDVMLIEGEYTDTAYLPPVTARDAVARNTAALASSKADSIGADFKAHVLAIPSYYDDYLPEKEQRIRENAASAKFNSASYAVISDIHWENNDKQSPALLNHIHRYTPVNRLIMLGDYATTDYSLPKSEGVWRLFNSLNSYLEKDIGMRRFVAIGNHEYNNPNLQHPEVEISQPELAGLLLTSQRDITPDSGTASFYFDDEVQKLRFLVTSCSAGSTLFPPMYRWLFEAMKNVPDGYKFVIVSHAGMKPSVTQPIADAVAAYRSREAYVYDYGSGKKTYDYTTAGAEVIAILAGDTHLDETKTYAGLMGIKVTSDARVGAIDGYTRTSGTVTEQAFDVMTFDLGNNCIRAVRIGAGFDRIWHYAPLSLTTSATVTADSKLGTVVWASDDETVAMVMDGVIERVGSGSCIISATGDGGSEYWNIVSD